MDDPRTHHRSYHTVAPWWLRCRDVMAGGDAVKDRGTAYLPMLDGQTLAQYRAYQQRAVFSSFASRTAQGLSGAIFRKDPVVTVPPAITEHLTDVSLADRSFLALAVDLVGDVLEVGRCGLLVDLPEIEGSRPYWIYVAAEQIINWRTRRRGGDTELDLVVIHETVTHADPGNRFVEVLVEQYRVLELVDDVYVVHLWTETSAGTWAEGPPIVPQRRGQPLPFLPFTFFGPFSTDPEPQPPPLLGVVDLNVSHYRTSADLEHGRHYCALPTPWVSGSSLPDTFMIGPSQAWNLGGDGHAGMLEFSGAGLGALEKALDEKQRMMAILGARLLEEQPPQAETATAVLMRHAGEFAALRVIADAVSAGLSQVLRHHAWWADAALSTLADTAASARLNTDFLELRITGDELRAQIEALQMGAISQETFYYNLARGGMTRPGIDAAAELNQIAEEQAAARDKDDARAADVARRRAEQNPNPPMPEEDAA